MDRRSDHTSARLFQYSEIHEFFTAYRCSSLYRGLFEVRDKNYVISIATVGMPIHDNATRLHSLLFDRDEGHYRPIAGTRRLSARFLQPRGHVVEPGGIQT